MNTARDELIADALRREIKAMRDYEPEPLLDVVNNRLRRQQISIDADELLTAIPFESVNSQTLHQVHLAVLQWDNAPESANWTAGSKPSTVDRRVVIYELLDLEEAARAAFDHEFPTMEIRDAMIVDTEDWDAWYQDRALTGDFYWNAYRGVLEGKGWDVHAIATLDRATTEIVERLANPTAEVGYQTKGLVVGHVQSGKTANFTGFIAKAVDAGYRLIIVLTGTIELLRTQTQRRLDMELVGEQNILDGADRSDEASIREIDYIGDGDEDWAGKKFLDHQIDIHSTVGVPAIKRLTTAKRDYRKLRLGRDALDFRRAGGLVDPSKPVFHPENIGGVDVRLAVMKKNKASLEALLHDLRNIHADSAELPVLIIDDEADQASINTVNQAKVVGDAPKRNKINSLIVKMLEVMPRAQYVGYTATPFANVFVSPDDAADLFPKDFILSLEPSKEYVGGRHFHDLEYLEPSLRSDPAHSNERAFVRDLRADPDKDPYGEKREILHALDAFVLSGAIKLWRHAQDSSRDYRHHTMLVHTSQAIAEHHALASTIRSVWTHAAYLHPESMPRLRKHYETDFVLVTGSRDEWASTGLPSTFDELAPFISEAVGEIKKHGDPVVEVNGGASSDYDALDFQKQRYWRIMVGGAKLSRGFTVEGLTVTYFRRRASNADTLMQMGRWFGYRPGYKDLVRLYIAREAVSGQRTFDMYEAFTAIVEDEEEFRSQLRQYSDLGENGKPLVRPIHVPPMVFQQLSWLKPVAANRMYNAKLDFEGQGGVFRDINALGAPGDGSQNRANFDAVLPLLDALEPELKHLSGLRTSTGDPSEYTARIAVVPAEVGLEYLRALDLRPADKLVPTIELVKRAVAEGKLVDWAVVAPTSSEDDIRDVHGRRIDLRSRRRRPAPRFGFSGSEPIHRAAIETIAEAIDARADAAGVVARGLASPTRGAILLNFADDPWAGGDEKDNWDDFNPPKPRRGSAKPAHIEPKGVATLLSLALPYASAPRGRIGFVVKRSDLPNSATVPVDDKNGRP